MTIIVFSEHTEKRTTSSTSSKFVPCFLAKIMLRSVLLMFRSVLCSS
jgi:hypothetical protein